MFCNNCGHYLEDGVSFCSNCGKPLGNNAVSEGQNMPTGGNSIYATNDYGYGMGNQQQIYNQQPIPYSMPVQPINPTVINVQQTPVKTKSANGYCVASFVLSMCSILIIPLIFGAAAVIFGIVGLATYDENKHTSKWMALVGIIVGAVGFIIGLFAVGLLIALFEYI